MNEKLIIEAFSSEKELKKIGIALMVPIRDALAKKNMKDAIDRILPPRILPNPVKEK